MAAVGEVGAGRFVYGGWSSAIYHFHNPNQPTTLKRTKKRAEKQWKTELKHSIWTRLKIAQQTGSDAVEIMQDEQQSAAVY